MKQLIIIGARGFGREVYFLAKRALGYLETYEIKGFLDNKLDALDNLGKYPPVLGTVEDYEIKKNDVFICALGDVKWKKHYVNLILQKGGNFINLIDKSAILGENINIGTGNIISNNCNLSVNISVGNFCTLLAFTTLGHDVKIGNFNHIGAYCFLGGFCIVGNETTLYVRSTILDRIKIGKNVTIGAGSLVIKNIKDGLAVFGSPAKKMEF